jgi:hypothetical protein
MAKINITPLLDSINGFEGATGTITAVAYKGGVKAIREVGEDLIFPSSVVYEFEDGEMVEDFYLTELPEDYYWKITFDADGLKDFVAYRVLPGDDAEYNWDELAHVFPEGTDNIITVVGPKGDQGEKGDTGETGATGPQGPAGTNGTNGATGATGAKGDKGDTGDTGPQGEQGIQGPQGIQGIQGIQGEKGDKGDTGDEGDKYHTTSTTSLTIAASGTITLYTVDLHLDYSVAQTVIIAHDLSNHMHGEVVSYNQSTGALVVSLKNKTGSGTYSSWEVNLDGAVGIQGDVGPAGPTGATGPQGPQGIQGIQGATGATGSSGTISVNAPITNTGTSTAAVLGFSGSITAASASTVPLTLQAATSQSANMFELRNSAGTGIMASLDSTGNLRTPAVINPTTYNNSRIQMQNSGVLIDTQVASNLPLAVRGATSQTENMQVWQTWNGTSATTAARVSQNGSIATSQNLAVGQTAITNTNQFQVSTTAATQVGAVLKGYASQSADMLQVQDSGGTNYLTVTAYGGISSNLGGNYPGRVSIGTGAAATLGLVVRGVTSQSADLLQLQNVGATSVFKVGPSGDATFGYAYISGLRDSAGTGPYLNTGAASMVLNTRSAANLGLDIQAATSQTGDLQRWTDASSTVVTKVNSAGLLSTTRNITIAGTNAGENQFIVRGAASQTGKLSMWTDSSGTSLAEIDASGYFSAANTPRIYVVDSDYYPDVTTTTAKSICGAATTGITLGVGTYEFELDVALQQDYVLNNNLAVTHNMTATTVSGSPTVAFVQVAEVTSNQTGFTTGGAWTATRNTTGSVTVSGSIASGSRYSLYKVRGTIRITGSGTSKVYPSVTPSLSTDNTVIIKAGSRFKVTKLTASGTVGTVGTWA